MFAFSEMSLLYELPEQLPDKIIILLQGLYFSQGTGRIFQHQIMTVHRKHGTLTKRMER